MNASFYDFHLFYRVHIVCNIKNFATINFAAAL